MKYIVLNRKAFIAYNHTYILLFH